MTSQQLTLIAPLASPLPPLPEGEVLTKAQWTTLMAIGDAIIPSIGPSNSTLPNTLALEATEYGSAISKLESNLPENASRDIAHRYLAESASATPGLRELLHRMLTDYVRTDARKGICVVLSALE